MAWLESFVLDEPNWLIVTALGAVLGATAQWWWLAARHLLVRWKPHRMQGEWHECHYTFRYGREELGRGRLTIKKGLLHRVAVTIYDEERHVKGKGHGLDYSGELTGEDHILISVRERNHPHTVVMRFNDPLPSNPEPIVGLWLSEDHDRCPAAGVTLLTRDRLSDEQACALLRRHSAIGRRALRIKPHADLKEGRRARPTE
ncbi:hypothetical protein [Streptosporangium sp. NPDC049046]|uniref:hypothetical protein n=1 Tax=Streptosporangium sp. NPDC049046 TaxID=3155031 RepID=UPI003427445C